MYGAAAGLSLCGVRGHENATGCLGMTDFFASRQNGEGLLSKTFYRPVTYNPSPNDRLTLLGLDWIDRLVD